MDLPAKSRAAWWAVGAVLAFALAFVAYSFVGTLVLAVFVYYGTRPFYRQLRGRVGSKSLAAALALLALALPVVLLVAYAVAIGLQEFNRFRETADLGPLEDALRPYLDISDIVADPGTVLSDPSAREALETALGSALDSLGIVGTGLLHLFIVFAAAFYMLRDGPRLTRWVIRRFGDRDGVLVTFVDRVDGDLHGVFTGNLLNAVFTAAIGAVVFSLVDLVAPAGSAIPYPALLGLLAGAASLIPVVGMKLVYVPVAGYLFGVAVLNDAPLWFPVLFTVLALVVVDTIPDLLLRPYVSGRNLHVGLVMFAYIFGPLLFGWYGIFLGPLVLVVVYHFADLILPELVGGKPIRPFGVDPGTGPQELAEPPGSADTAAAETTGDPSDPPDDSSAESRPGPDGDPSHSPDGGVDRE
jgi:predicted PurR-regulated permease PerM